MNFSLVDVDRAEEPVRAYEGADLTGLPRARLLELLTFMSAGSRAWELATARVAGEVARRSTADDGPGGMARQEGFASPEQFVASVLGTSYSEGAQLVNAGAVLTQDRPLAEGLLGGTLSVAKADLIAQTVKSLAGDTAELESRLTRAAAVLDFARLKMMCRSEGARHDATQLEDRERRQANARSLEISEDAFGMTHIRASLDPVRAAFVRTFLDAQVKAAFQARRDGSVDKRTAAQIRADALVAMAAHGLDCEAPAAGVKATIIVRIDRDQLEQEVGVATCDAISTPISLNALREVAVDASVLPVVMNGKSVVLDQGREQRLFSWQQRMALAERDGGCAKCHAPISHCITHHIRWWSAGGRTDLRNGVLLCVRCHTQIHHDRWGIEVDDDNRVWFIAPRHVDPERHRILGGLAALAFA